MRTFTQLEHDDGNRPAPTAPRKVDWVNTLFILTAHVLAVVAIWYMAAVQFSWWTVGLFGVYSVMCAFGITAGYHRLFSHRAFKANPLVRAVLLFFGAAAIQNSALKWCNDHRLHHARVDSDFDPYNIKRGFWWAHVGWIFFKYDQRDPRRVADLLEDRLVVFQDRYYLAIAIFAGSVVPFCLGLLWGDPIGAVLVAGFLRLVLLWHAAFSVNSAAHWFGTQEFGDKTSARDSVWVALITMGEGYHNFHHTFPTDYRNGVRWYHFDPTKWLISVLSKVRLTYDLRKTSKSRIQRARE